MSPYRYVYLYIHICITYMCIWLNETYMLFFHSWPILRLAMVPMAMKWLYHGRYNGDTFFFDHWWNCLLVSKMFHVQQYGGFHEWGIPKMDGSQWNIIEGSLEVKLPTIWTDEKQSRGEAERRGRLEERRWEEKGSEERRYRCAKR